MTVKFGDMEDCSRLIIIQSSWKSKVNEKETNNATNVGQLLPTVWLT